MTYIKDYWENKEGRKEIAMDHTKEMAKKFGKEITYSVSNTKLYDTDFSFIPDRSMNTEIKVVSMDSVNAICKYQNGKTAVLNFASYKNPGGMFLNGSKAQEECLCHESFLYNVLETQKNYYTWNNLHKNRALYLNRALYSPHILFRNAVPCDVITCACPNKSAAQKYQNVSNEENLKVLNSRIKFVLDIAEANNVETLILGAFGAGVFGQDATEVAEVFKKHLRNYGFKKVVFAITAGPNLTKFQKVFR